MHDAERIVRDDEARVGLDRPRQQVHRGLVALLIAAQRRDLSAREQLERPWHPGRARPFLDPSGFRIGQRDAERTDVRDRQRGESRKEVARRRRQGLEAHGGVDSTRLQLHQLGQDGEVAPATLDAPEERGVGAHRARGLDDRRVAPGVRSTRGAQP